jgi:tRNA A-37 threonylcarbamoyl transferase component Bud32
MATRLIYASSPDWAVMGTRLDDLLASPDFQVLKNTSRTLAGIARVEGAEVFVKRVKNAGWGKGIAARMCGSRAKRTLRGAAILQRAGFAHPQVIAAFEQVERGAVGASYVVTERLHRPRVLSRFALSDGRDFYWRQSLSKHLARTIRALHDRGCYTRDLQETNLMLEVQNGELKVYFIDLENFRWLPMVPLRLRLLNLVHLDRSIGRFISRSQRLRFLYNYLGGKPARAQARTIVRQLGSTRNRIERHKRREQRSKAIITPAVSTESASELPLRCKSGQEPVNAFEQSE